MPNIKKKSLAHRLAAKSYAPVIVAGGLFGFVAVYLINIEFFEWFYDISRAHEDWDLDEWAVIVVATVMATLAVSTWKWRQAARELREAQEVLHETLRVEGDLRHSLEESRQDSKAHVMLMATMSHELRTPLNSIIGYSELLEPTARGRLTEREASYFDNILSSSRILSATIERVLELARLDSEETAPAMEATNLLEAVTEVVSVLDIQAVNKGLLITVDVPRTETIMADPIELRSVLFNIIGNAIKYTQFGSIRIDSRREATETVLTVSDTGRGMTETQLNTALAPFARVAPVDGEPDVEGSGIGLVIAKRIMERHGGRLLIDSKLTEGTRVTLTFPNVSIGRRPSH